MKKRSYMPEHTPFIADVSSYCDTWMKWWTSCQPAWRREKGWPLPRDNDGTTNWIKVGVRGQNGLFLVVMSTAWWAYSIRSEKEWAGFDEAVDDVEWVIGQVISSLKALRKSTPPIQPAPPKKSQKPNSGVRWMDRDANKRQPKLSRKLLDAHEG
jgi:hypothetical protein